MASTPPSPYTSANASADISVSEFMNVDCSIEVRTPMSRTRPARTANSRDSARTAEQFHQRRAGRRESFGHLGVHRRVVDRGLAGQLRHRARRCGGPAPRTAASSTSDSRVICHEMPASPPASGSGSRGSTTTPDSVSENARCAPMTSLPSLLTRAPVRVRVKNATGIRCTWSNTGGAQVEDQTFADGRRQPPRQQ